MRRSSLVALAAASLVSLLPRVADADPPPPPAVGTYTTRVIVIYGRPAKPMVAVEVKTPTAAEAAGAAHETFRQALLAKAEVAAWAL